MWSWARGHVHTKKCTRIIAQATRRCSCTGYSSNYFDSAYYMTDSRAYLVVGHIECQTRSGLSVKQEAASRHLFSDSPRVRVPDNKNG